MDGESTRLISVLSKAIVEMINDVLPGAMDRVRLTDKEDEFSFIVSFEGEEVSVTLRDLEA